MPANIEDDGSAFLADVPPETVAEAILNSGDSEKRNVLRNEIAVTTR